MKKISILLFLGPILIFFLSCTSRPYFSENKSIYGIVCDNENNPIPNAKIILNNFSTNETDAKGSFVFYNIRNKKNKIKIQSPLYKPFECHFNIEFENQFLQFRLEEMIVYINKAEEAILNKNYLEAELILNDAIMINPDFEPAYVFLSLLYYKEGEIKKLEELYSKAKKRKISKAYLERYKMSLDELVNKKNFDTGV